MTLSLIAAMTVAAFLILNAWFSERRLVISRTGDVFMLAWFYYGFAVAIDILLGLEIRGIPGMTDFSDPTTQSLVVQVLAYYLICGIAFCVAYGWVRRGSRQMTSPRSLILPPITGILGAHVVLLLLLYRVGYFGLTPPERTLLAIDSLPLRLLLLSVAAISALDLVIIIYSNVKWQVVAASGAALCLGLASGGRMEVMSVVLILVLKYRLSCGRVKFATAVVAMLAVLACWKSTYQYVYALAFESGADRRVFEFVNTSLCGIDSYGSSLVAVTTLGNDCPYFMGKTYIYDVIEVALPREWREATFLPLSKTFDWEYLPHRAAEGLSVSFSAIAESWLNFGPIGPALLGAIFGVAAKTIDSGRRGIAFYIFALMAFRLFRSDFASLCKSWIVIYGGTMCACYVACTLLNNVPDRQRRTQRAARRFLHPRSIG